MADVAYVSYYPIIVVALFMFQRASSARRDTLRLTIDSLIVVIGGGIVVWHTLFRPVLASLDPDPPAFAREVAMANRNGGARTKGAPPPGPGQAPGRKQRSVAPGTQAAPSGATRVASRPFRETKRARGSGERV